MDERKELEIYMNDAKLAQEQAERSFKEMKQAYDQGIKALQALRVAFNKIEQTVDSRKRSKPSGDFDSNSKKSVTYESASASGKEPAEDEWPLEIEDTIGPESKLLTEDELFDLWEKLEEDGEVEEADGASTSRQYNNEHRDNELGNTLKIKIFHNNKELEEPMEVDSKSNENKIFNMTPPLSGLNETSSSFIPVQPWSFIPEYELYVEEFEKNVKFVLVNEAIRAFTMGKGINRRNITTLFPNLPFYVPAPECYAFVKEYTRTMTKEIRLLPTEVWDHVLHGCVKQWLMPDQSNSTIEALNELRNKYVSQIDAHIAFISDERKNILNNSDWTYQPQTPDQLHFSRRKIQLMFHDVHTKIQ